MKLKKFNKKLLLHSLSISLKASEQKAPIFLYNLKI